MEALIVVALWLFVLVHIDTFLVLLAFCADEHYRLAEILVGHYVGFTIGLVGAIAGALLAADLLEGRSFLLGIVPLGLGVWTLWRRTPDPHGPAIPVAPEAWRRLFIVMAASIGVSGENIAVLVPFFTTLETAEILIIAVLYLVAAGLVFAIAWSVARRVMLVRIPPWIEEKLVPVILILVGGYVLGAGWIAA